jgi:hypothetical protein
MPPSVGGGGSGNNGGNCKYSSRVLTTARVCSSRVTASGATNRRTKMGLFYLCVCAVCGWSHICCANFLCHIASKVLGAPCQWALFYYLGHKLAEAKEERMKLNVYE